MSIIIGYKHNGIVYLATDTRIVDGGFRRTESLKTNFKIGITDDGILYGFVGDKMIRQLLKMNSDIFTLDRNGKLTHKHVVTSILPKYYALIATEGYLDKDEPLPFVGGSLFLAHKDSFYHIWENFNVCTYNHYQAVGEFSDCALPRVKTVDPSKNINKQLIKALEDCAYSTTYVGGPYLTIDTQNLQYELWEGSDVHCD